jgi:hypothetical protein
MGRQRGNFHVLAIFSCSDLALIFADLSWTFLLISKLNVVYGVTLDPQHGGSQCIGAWRMYRTAPCRVHKIDRPCRLPQVVVTLCSESRVHSEDSTSRPLNGTDVRISAVKGESPVKPVLAAKFHRMPSRPESLRITEEFACPEVPPLNSLD